MKNYNFQRQKMDYKDPCKKLIGKKFINNQTKSYQKYQMKSLNMRIYFKKN